MSCSSKNVLNVIADSSSADSKNYQTMLDASSTVISNKHKRKSEAQATTEFRVIMSEALSTMSVAAMCVE
jgi:hypothetical protein